MTEIKDENDYNLALERVDQLWNSESEEDREELDRLTDLIEEYEMLSYSDDSPEWTT